MSFSLVNFSRLVETTSFYVARTAQQIKAITCLLSQHPGVILANVQYKENWILCSKHVRKQENLSCAWFLQSVFMPAKSVMN